MPDHIVSTPAAALLEVANRLTGSEGFSDDAVPVGIARDGEVYAVAVFERFTATGADMHLGVEPGRRLGKRSIQALLKIAMHPDHLDLDTVWAPIPEANRRTQQFAFGVGFEFEARRRGYAFDGSDVILMALRRDKIFPRTDPAAASADIDAV